MNIPEEIGLIIAGTILSVVGLVALIKKGFYLHDFHGFLFFMSLGIGIVLIGAGVDMYRKKNKS